MVGVARMGRLLAPASMDLATIAEIVYATRTQSTLPFASREVFR